MNDDKNKVKERVPKAALMTIIIRAKQIATLQLILDVLVWL